MKHNMHSVSMTLWKPYMRMDVAGMDIISLSPGFRLSLETFRSRITVRGHKGMVQYKPVRYLVRWYYDIFWSEIWLLILLWGVGPHPVVFQCSVPKDHFWWTYGTLWSTGVWTWVGHMQAIKYSICCTIAHIPPEHHQIEIRIFWLHY